MGHTPVFDSLTPAVLPVRRRVAPPRSQGAKLASALPRPRGTTLTARRPSEGGTGCLCEDTAVPTEADACRTYVVPALYAAGWSDEQIREQVSFTPGRIIVGGGTVRRGKRKRADYLLSYLRDRPLAVVEAKAEYRLPGDGLQQAKDYAEILDLKFAYSTNGPGIVEHDYTTGLELNSRVSLTRRAMAP